MAGLRKAASVLWKQDELGHEHGPEALSLSSVPLLAGSEKCVTSFGSSLWFAPNHLDSAEWCLLSMMGQSNRGVISVVVCL